MLLTTDFCLFICLSVSLSLSLPHPLKDLFKLIHTSVLPACWYVHLLVCYKTFLGEILLALRHTLSLHLENLAQRVKPCMHGRQYPIFFFNFFRFYLFIMYTTFLPCMPAGQKRAPDLIIDGCEPPCGCWELNSGPLEEHSVLLTSEPSLQPCL